MNRRDFLLGTTALPALAAAAEKAPAAAAPAANEWAAVREQFDLGTKYVHGGLFFLATNPRVVREAIEKHRKGLDDDPLSYTQQLEDTEEESRKAAAEYLEVKPEEICLTESTTMGLGLVYGCLKLEPGDEVLTTAHDHYSTAIALEHRVARDGITVKSVALYDSAAPEAASAAKMTEAIVKAVTPKTRLVAITWVHSCSGVKTPVRAIADALGKLNAGRDPSRRVLLSVDGVHGFAAEDTSMPKLGCDIFITGLHKWLFGPRGTGLLWMKSDVWPLMQPTIPTFSGDAYPMWMGVMPKAPLAPALLNTPGGFKAWEHRWAMPEAFRWHAGLGKARVAARIHALNRQFKEGLAKLKHVKLRTPLSDEVSCGIDTLEVAGLEPRDVVKKLHEKNVLATVTPYRAPRFARVSFGILNSPEDVEAVLKAIKGLA